MRAEQALVMEEYVDISPIPLVRTVVKAGGLLWNAS